MRTAFHKSLDQGWFGFLIIKPFFARIIRLEFKNPNCFFPLNLNSHSASLSLSLSKPPSAHSFPNPPLIQPLACVHHTLSPRSNPIASFSRLLPPNSPRGGDMGQATNPHPAAAFRIQCIHPGDWWQMVHLYMLYLVKMVIFYSKWWLIKVA